MKAKVPAARGPAQAKAGKLLSLESRECESLRVAKALFGQKVCRLLLPLRLSCTSQHQKVQVSYVKFTVMQLLSSLAPPQNVASQRLLEALSQPPRLDHESGGQCL